MCEKKRERWSHLPCRNCGDVVDPQRVALGYDYCLNDCQRRCMQRVLLAAVGVNRAADHYVRAEEVVVPTAPPASPTSEDDEIPGPRAASPRPTPQNGLKTTLERLREKERELDTALQRTYERFCRGEVTAREMDRERDGLVRAFNRLVMAENIRYGSMLGTDAGRRHGKR